MSRPRLRNIALSIESSRLMNIKHHPFLVILVCCLINVGLILPSHAASKSESWGDPNYALCEGLGVFASGRINGTINYEINGDMLRVTSLVFDTVGYQKSHIPSGMITYIAVDGSSHSTNLQTPWFDVMRAAGPGASLLLPRNKSGNAGPSSAEQMEFVMKKGTAISINITLLFSVPGGNCPTSFSTDWIVE